MLILNLSTQDFAGLGYDRCEALRKHVGVEAYSVVTLQGYVGYPYHFKLGVNLSPDQLREMLEKADVVHLNEIAFKDNTGREWFGQPGVSVGHSFPVGLPFSLGSSEKVFVRELHSIRQLYSDEAYGNLLSDLDKFVGCGGGVLVSNPDLLTMHPTAVCIAKPLGIDQIESTREQYRRERMDDDEFYVVQTPTGIVDRHTNLLRHACSKLRKKKLRIHEAIIEYKQHNISLMAKALSDAGFAHLRGFLDVSALESMALGKPTIAHIDKAWQDWLQKLGGPNYMPIVDCEPNVDSVENALYRLYTEEEYYFDRAKAADEFIQRFHNEEKISQEYLAWIEKLREDKSVEA